MFHLGNLDLFLISDPSFNYFLSEIANYLYCILIVALSTYFRLIEKEYFVFWCLYFLSPFFVNFVLFDPMYMPDQFFYIEEIVDVKLGNLELPIFTLGIDLDTIKNSRIAISAYLLSFIPIFSLTSITSVAFVNKLLIFLTFLFLGRRLEPKKLMYFLIIPSLVLYSSVALRDTLVLCLGIVSIVYLIERRPFISLFAILLILLTKIQNAPGFLVVWLLFFIFYADKSYLRICLMSILGVISTILLFEYIDPIVNLYRLAWAVEDGMSLEAAKELNISSGFELIYLTFKQLPSFLLNPLPWNISGGFQLMIFLESIFLIYLLYLFAIKEKFYKDKECIVLLIGLLVCMGLHAVTVFNFGTLARYRFIGFLPFLIGFYMLRTKMEKYKHELAS